MSRSWHRSSTRREPRLRSIMLFQEALHTTQRLDAHGEAAIRDTLTSVFRGPAYDRSAQRTLAGALWNAFERAARAIVDLFSGSAPLRSVALWAGFALIALIVARFIYVAAQRGRFGARRDSQRADAANAAADPWLAAQHAAAEGRYTEAAHFLYAALLVAIARRERLRLHPSKTAGDYVRELRARSSKAFSPFRGFVRVFEFIVYGRGECDRAQFEQLRSLAEPLLRPGE
jgi:hypothetical protein